MYKYGCFLGCVVALSGGWGGLFLLSCVGMCGGVSGSGKRKLRAIPFWGVVRSLFVVVVASYGDDVYFDDVVYNVVNDSVVCCDSS